MTTATENRQLTIMSWPGTKESAFLSSFRQLQRWGLMGKTIGAVKRIFYSKLFTQAAEKNENQYA